MICNGNLGNRNFFPTRLNLEFNLNASALFYVWVSRKKKTVQAVNTNIKMTNPMMQLRKIVNHPYLVKWEVDIETGD